MRKVISTFSGVGGSSLGYKLAGCEVLCALEFIPIAAKNYKANFRQTPIVEKDIRVVKGQELLKLARVNKEDLDILDGSPPCASYSSSGVRQKNWKKEKIYSEGVSQRTDNLFDEQIRLIKEIQPKAIVIENVKGMTTGVARPILMSYMKQIQDLGYNIKAEVLSAQYFETATERHRMFLVGIRSDLKIEASLPKPFSPPISLRQAIKNVKNTEEEIKEARKMLEGNTHKKTLARTLKQGEEGSDVHRRRSYFNLKRMRWDKPIKALTTHNMDFIHPTEDRVFTIRELKACSSFPENFILIGDYDQMLERIGRAVPPNLMKHVANHVCKLLDESGN